MGIKTNVKVRQPRRTRGRSWWRSSGPRSAAWRRRIGGSGVALRSAWPFPPPSASGGGGGGGARWPVLVFSILPLSAPLPSGLLHVVELESTLVAFVSLSFAPLLAHLAISYPAR